MKKKDFICMHFVIERLDYRKLADINEVVARVQIGATSIRLRERGLEHRNIF